MKAQCERCKEIVPLEFVVEGNGIRVTCPACHETYPVSAPGPEPQAQMPEHEMVCPKCGHGQRAAEACRRCGLIIARWNPDAAEVAATDGLADLWQACTENWVDAARHEAFIDACRRADLLAYAAARYRGREGAEERLAQIRSLAEQSLAAMPRTEMSPEQKRARMATGVMVLIALLAVIAFLTHVISSRGGAP